MKGGVSRLNAQRSCPGEEAIWSPCSVLLMVRCSKNQEEADEAAEEGKFVTLVLDLRRDLKPHNLHHQCAAISDSRLFFYQHTTLRGRVTALGNSLRYCQSFLEVLPSRTSSQFNSCYFSWVSLSSMISQLSLALPPQIVTWSMRLCRHSHTTSIYSNRRGYRVLHCDGRSCKLTTCTLPL